jgi:hypothetical protein
VGLEGSDVTRNIDEKIMIESSKIRNVIRLNWFRIVLTIWLIWFSIIQHNIREEIDHLSGEVSQLQDSAGSSEINKVKVTVIETSDEVQRTKSIVEQTRVSVNEANKTLEDLSRRIPR